MGIRSFGGRAGLVGSVADRTDARRQKILPWLIGESGSTQEM